MFKKGLLMMIAFTVFFAFTAATSDAKPRGGMKSPKQSYTTTPSKSSDTGSVSSGTKSGSTAGSAAGTPAKRGFFSGGSMLKGMMIGGLAGLLFGSMFANMGFFGDFLGLLVNVLALYILFIAIRSIVVYFRNRRKTNERRPY